jgi:hypothetical protein
VQDEVALSRLTLAVGLLHEILVYTCAQKSTVTRRVYSYISLRSVSIKLSVQSKITALQDVSVLSVYISQMMP